MAETTVITDNDQQLEELVRRAMFRLGQFFKKTTHDGEERADAKVATSVLATWARNNQNKNADRSLTVVVAKELGLTRDQFAQVVKETMPQLGIARLLTGGTVLPIEEENEKLKTENAQKSAMIVNLQQQLAQPK